MLDDRNKDPTFTYKVPDAVYKVPTPAEHAAEKVLHTRVLGGVLTGECSKADKQAWQTETDFCRTA
jgi:hypothetical protein